MGGGAETSGECQLGMSVGRKGWGVDGGERR